MTDLEPPLRFRRFPPRHGGVLLPLGDRRGAALGLTMYTVSKPWPVRAHGAAFRVTRVLGARFLPGQTVSWSPPFPTETWRELLSRWEETCGPFSSIAIYARPQTNRTGLTLYLSAKGRPVAVVKVRDQFAVLQREQIALQHVQMTRPTTFRVPKPLGAGVAGGLAWSAQEAVFAAPHQPVLSVPQRLFDDLRNSLAYLANQDGDPAHGDLTPWNLRLDADRQVWLFDWEDVGSAPRGSDRAYFAVTSASLGAPLRVDDVPRPALAYWRHIVAERLNAAPTDSAYLRHLLEITDRALNVASNEH